MKFGLETSRQNCIKVEVGRWLSCSALYFLFFRPERVASECDDASLFPSMLALLLTIVCGSIFMLSIKWVQVRNREDEITVGAINYIVAAVTIAYWYFTNPSQSDPVMAAWCGASMGLCYFIAYFFVIAAIRWVGAASSTAVAVLSILLPIFCGIFIWDENPNAFQIVGIALALISLALISHKENTQTSERPWFTPLVLLIFFLLAGFSRLAQEAFKHESTLDQRPTFLFAAFALAAVPSVLLLIYRGKIPSLSEWGCGMVMGLANMLQTHFILKALQQFDGFVVFPAVSAGQLIFTCLVATQWLNEKLTVRTYWGIGLASIALILLNWMVGVEESAVSSQLSFG